MRLLQDRLARLAEDDAARQRIAFDVELRAAAAAPFAARRRTACAMSSRMAARTTSSTRPMRLRALPVERLAVEDDVERGGKADQARQLRGAAPRRKDAELRLRQADLRLRAVGHDAVVAADGQLAAAAEAGAVDRGDGDLRQLREAVKRLLAEARVLAAPVRRDVAFVNSVTSAPAMKIDGLPRGDDDALDVAERSRARRRRRRTPHHRRSRTCSTFSPGRSNQTMARSPSRSMRKRGPVRGGASARLVMVRPVLRRALIGVFVDVHARR